MPASREFMVICQAQLALMEESLGLSSAIIYLTEAWGEEATPRLRQVAAVPIDSPGSTLQLMPAGELSVSVSPSTRTETAVHQLVLPLLQEEQVLGVLVAERSRPWDAAAQPQMDAVLQTLTMACLVDQRSQWLEQQAVQQQVLQRQQKDVLDNLLHQFRNPLTAMRTFGKLLVKRLVEGDRNQEAANTIVRESERLQALLTQFEAAIDLDRRPEETLKLLQAHPSSPESTAPVLMPSATLGQAIHLERIALQSILKPVMQSASGVISDRQQQLQVKTLDAEVWVFADAIALAEVLANLLDNASKYSPEGGQIQVELLVAIEQVELWITDTGYGIPPEDLEHLFERHYRGVQAKSEIPGTGLGLAIARDLTRQMQGEIRVFSPPPMDHVITSQPPSIGSDFLGTSIQVTLKKA